MAVSDGLPSRRKNPPGIFPAADIRSSTPTGSGGRARGEHLRLSQGDDARAVCLLGELARLGDEFGSADGLAGSDHWLSSLNADRAVAVGSGVSSKELWGGFRFRQLSVVGLGQRCRSTRFPGSATDNWPPRPSLL